MQESSATLAFILADEAATVTLGEKLGQLLVTAKEGIVIYLWGDLGAGKTTFTRGVLRAFGHQGAVKSPTYTLVEDYALPARHVFHFDLYRLNDPEELEYMGIRDYFAADNVCIVEWASRGEGILPPADLEVVLMPSGDGRCVRVHGLTPKGQLLVAAIQARLHTLPHGVSICENCV